MKLGIALIILLVGLATAYEDEWTKHAVSCRKMFK